MGKNNQNIFCIRIDCRESEYTTYIGTAKQGSSPSDKKWRIRKLVFNKESICTGVLYANGSTLYNKIWSNRSNGTYSYH